MKICFPKTAASILLAVTFGEKGQNLSAKKNSEPTYLEIGRFFRSSSTVSQKFCHFCPLFRCYFFSFIMRKWILGFFCLVFLACQSDKEAIVQAKVAERVSIFEKNKRNECRETLLEKAERIVDSLLLTDAQLSLLDSLSRNRPNRPYQPAPIPPIDSLQVQPIFSTPQTASSTGGQ